MVLEQNFHPALLQAVLTNKGMIKTLRMNKSKLTDLGDILNDNQKPANTSNDFFLL